MLEQRMNISVPSSHRIRLRGGWLFEAGQKPVRYIALPINWSTFEHKASRIVLSRSFGSPRIDPSRERVSIEFADAPGIVHLDLNGTDLSIDEAQPWRIWVDRLFRDRNVLAMTVDVGRIQEISQRPENPPIDEWGSISLLIESGLEPIEDPIGGMRPLGI